MDRIGVPVGDYDITLPLPVRTREALKHFRHLRPPSSQALKLAEDLAERVRRRTAQVRRGFIARSSPNDPPPPLAEILRSGRGGAIRLKLYLSVLWIAAGKPHIIQSSAQAWATLLDLEDPTGKAARQVRSSFRWLKERHLIEVSENPGVGSTIKLLSDLGRGDEYSVPGLSLSEARRTGHPGDPRDFYVGLPDVFWTQGWIHVLSGPAVAMLLILLDVRRGQDPSRALWFSPRVAEERYTLSEETRAKGIGELAALDVIRVTSKPVRADQLAAARYRHTYDLKMERLTNRPLEEMTDSET